MRLASIPMRQTNSRVAHNTAEQKLHGYGGLAYTGLGSIALGSLVLNQVWLVGLAFVLILAGALLVRYSFRRAKSPRDI